jgi:hypothetical protein
MVLYDVARDYLIYKSGLIKKAHLKGAFSLPYHQRDEQKSAVMQ